MDDAVFYGPPFFTSLQHCDEVEIVQNSTLKVLAVVTDVCLIYDAFFVMTYLQSISHSHILCRFKFRFKFLKFQIKKARTSCLKLPYSFMKV